MQIAGVSIGFGVTGLTETLSGINQVGSALRGIGGGGRGGGGGGAIRADLMPAIAALDEVVMLARFAGQALNAVTGTGIAAEYMGIKTQISTVTGSASEASRALSVFRDIGLNTKFDTAEVAAYGQQFLNLGDSVHLAGQNMASTLDLAAAGGLKRENFQRFMTNLGQIRSGGITGIADMRQMLSAAPGMGRILGQQMGLGRNATAKDLIGAYRQMGPEGFFGMMMQASRQPGIAGAAERLTPLEAIGNTLEALNVIMEPTGRIFLGILMPIGAVINNLAQFAGAINRLGMGLPGLAVLGYAVVRSWTFLVGAARLAKDALDALTVTLGRIAAVGRTAGASTGVGGLAAGAGVAAGAAAARGGAAAGGLASALGWVGGAVVIAGKFLAFLKQFAGGIAGIALAIGGSLIGGDWGAVLSNAGIGATIGSIVPGVGTVLGAVIGGILGGVGTLGWQAWGKKSEGGQDSTAKEIAQNTKEAADALKEMKGQAIGGGRRFGMGVSLAEAEIGLAMYRRFGNI